ncbi:MAG: PKD domain-containing protein [Bacteroidetes bacterium]|nr:PKD domain-containing protein [Bacteroidota bacterium]
MKLKYILFIIILIGTSSSSFATSYTWVGTTSDWANSNNWYPSGIPDSADFVTISSGTNGPLLDGNRKITNLTLSSKTIDLNGFSLTVYGTATMTSGTVTNGTFYARGNLASFNGTLMDCPVDAVCGYIRLSGSTFNETADFTDLGAATGTGSGGCTFNDDVTITHTGTLTYFTLANTTGDTFNGNVTFTNNSNREIHIASSGATLFNGNIILNSTSSGGISFASGGGSATLASGKTISIGSSGFAADFLTLKNFTQNGSTAQTLTLTGTAIVNMIAATFNGNITVTAPGILLKNSTFNGTATLTRNGSSGNHQSDGGNTFNTLTLDNAGSAGRVRWATTLPDTYNADATFNSTGGQDVQIAYSGDNTFAGNITINSSKVVFNTSTGKVTFTGTNNQTLNGSYNYPFKKLAINKSAGTVTANTTLSVDDSLIFNQGNLITTSTNLLTMKNGSTATGASNNSFVSGPVKKVGNSSFEFPIGKGSDFRFCKISSTLINTDTFTAEYFDSNQSQGNVVDSTFENISMCNYWKLDRNVGNSKIKITLSWDSLNCSYQNRIYESVIAQYNGNMWVNKRMSGFNGGYTFGSISSLDSLNSFGYFTIGQNKLVVSNCILPINSNCQIELVCNGGFEQGLQNSNLPLYPLSFNSLNPSSSEVVNWQDDMIHWPFGNSDIHIRQSAYQASPYIGTSFPPTFGIPDNIFTFCYGGLDTWNTGGSVQNDRYCTFNYKEGLATNLIIPIAPGNTYTFSCQIACTEVCFNSQGTPVSNEISIQLIQDINMANPAVFDIQSNMSVTCYQGWSQITSTFTIPNGMPSFENLVIFANWVTDPNLRLVYNFIDDVSLTTDEFATFTVIPACITQPTLFNSYYADPSTVVTYAWDFGDGSTSTVQNPTHTYAIPGYYEVALTVTTPSCTNCFRKVIFISPSCCAVDGTVSYDDATVVPDVISSDVTWSQPFKLNRTIFVEAGVTLTIAASNVIEFGPEGRIILDRRDPATATGTGAKMIMELLSELTSITNSEPGCPVMWQGVEVWGNSNVNHNSNANRNAHGFLDMKEQSKIRNAHNGVILGKTLMPFDNSCDPPTTDPAYPPYDLAFCGGILDANESNSFIGNGVGVRMLPFRYNNFSLISSCYFEGGVLLDQFYDSGNTFFYSGSNFPNRTPWYGEANQKGRSCIGIYMWSIKDLTLDGNDFHDIQAGIESFNAAFKTKYNTFDDHQYGIDVNNTVSSPNYVFRCFENNTFINISHIGIGNSCTATYINNAGIRIRGGINNKIQVSNIFGDVVNTFPQPSTSIGIQLLSCNGTRILDNQFGDLFFGIYSSGSFINSGLIGLNTTGNIFTDIRHAGVFSLNNNPALRLKCNLWTSPNTICQGFVCWRNSGTLPSQQGFAGANHQRPAGNEWNLDNENDFITVTSGFPFTYHHHSPVFPYLSVVPILNGGAILSPNNVPKSSSSCIPAPLLMEIEESSFKLDSIETLIDSIAIVKIELVNGLDGEQTENLLEFIADPMMTQDALSDSLILNSPLSESVILAFLNSPYHLTDSTVFAVMKYNLPISNGLFDAFKSRLEGFYDSNLADSLIILYGDNPSIRTPFGLERELEKNKLEKYDLVDFIADELARNDSTSALVEFLRQQEDKNYQMQAAASAIEIDSLILAREIINEIDIVTTSDEYWADIMDIVISLKDSGNTLSSMDSTILNRVMEIASSALDSFGTRNAQCILKLVYGIDFDEGESETLRYSNPNHTIGQINANSKVISSLSIQPNPANHTILINLPNRNIDGLIKIFDISGKLINFIEVKPELNKVEIRTENYSSGIYQLLYLSDDDFDTQKFIIQH